MIYIESLQATNYQGDAENTVKRETKSDLNRSTSAQSWHEFRR